MMLPTHLGTAAPASRGVKMAGAVSRTPLRCGSNHRSTLHRNSRQLLGRSIVPDGKRADTLESRIQVIQDPETASGHQTPARPVGPWTVTIKTSKQSFLGKTLGLSLKVINENGERSSPILVDSKSWKEDKYERPSGFDGLVHIGTNIPGPTPLAIEVQQTFANPKDADDFVNRTFIVNIEFKGSNGQTVTFLANSWITKDARIFFPGDALLPSKTPAALLKLRQKELNDLKGVDNPKAKDTRTFDDRIYEYQTYNDLSLDPAKWKDGGKREPLGGSSLPYPRRIRTGRPNYVVDGKDTGIEVVAPKRPVVSSAALKLMNGQIELAVPWLPMDDDFDNVKTLCFQIGNIAAVLPMIQEAVPILGSSKGKIDHYDDVKEILALYDDDDGVLGPDHSSLLGKVVEKLRVRFSNNIRKYIAEKLAQMKDDDSDIANLLRIGSTVLTPAVKNTPILDNLFEYPPPRAIANRTEAWRTDEELGRQMLAGQNPFTLEAITQLPANSSITEKDIAPFLEGHTVAQLAQGQKRRLFAIDYYTHLVSELDAVNAQKTIGDPRVQHAGHCILYLRNDGHLVPVAIDLTAKTGEKPAVYTPASPATVWFVAKAIFKTLDSAWHQLVCHWMRTHACMEPYLIATRRNLSVMHPIFKLIMPHFRYTMAINGNARATLVNADAPLEHLFTAGGLIMPLGSKVYRDTWRFDQQSLPADLKLRGILDSEGKLVVDDYPYAQDGLLIWNALEKYFTNYINHYYASDDVIKADPELQAWWKDILVNGHPDKKEGWPSLNTRADLLQITTTMAWVGAGHHTAVNFGQYDYSGFMPDHASLVTKPMPRPGQPEYQTLEKTKPGKDADKLLLSYLSGKATSVQYYLIVKTLSGHAEDEQYLSDEKATEEWHTDPAAIGFHRQFVDEIKKSMVTIDQRNADPAMVSRNPAKAGLPYKLLYAASGPGMTSQGVPFSVST